MICRFRDTALATNSAAPPTSAAIADDNCSRVAPASVAAGEQGRQNRNEWPKRDEKRGGIHAPFKTLAAKRQSGARHSQVDLWFAKNASGAKDHVSTSIASGSREPGRPDAGACNVVLHGCRRQS
jgi:hypothetical protein